MIKNNHRKLYKLLYLTYLKYQCNFFIKLDVNIVTIVLFKDNNCFFILDP